MLPHFSIVSEDLRVEISQRGAELQRIVTPDGHDLLWDGDPAFWTGRAPLLFPIVGELNEGHYRYAGRNYAMRKHGFARKSQFDVVEQRTDRVTLRLVDTPKTHDIYPFEFILDVTHSIDGATLSTEAVVTNTGTKTMPTSFGFHPALRWPLPFGGARADHKITFPQDEPADIRRIDDDGLLLGPSSPTPVDGQVLLVDDALFVDDAVIFDQLNSRSLRYGAAGYPIIRADFPAMPLLGVWTKPGAGYVCIEPWQGHADPDGFTGDIRDKPGVILIQPGDERRFAMSLTLER
ncbi:aldose 1-epimerase family protein [Novosphingobium sp.]|uniref:aldose 1-epimerase family protein n=1 Tax=Novosphingobium sp. TaxID=1874826 RepID=UPI0025D11216|nr:aldose 1-epimerase family protein [Novosphingobium sp.]